MRPGIGANLAWLFAERVVVTLVVFVSNVYVIRTLGADGFGELALFQVWLALTLTGTEFGLRRIFLALGRSRALQQVLAATLRLKYCVAAVLAIAIVAAIGAIDAPPQYLLLLLVVLFAPLEAYVYHFEAQLRNDLLARIRVTLALALAAARVALCVGGFGILPIATTYVLLPVLLGIACRLVAQRDGVRAQPAARRARDTIVLRHVLRRGAFMFASMLVVLLHARSDQLLLASLAGPAELGIYAGAYKFLEQLMMIPVILNGVLLPAMSRRGQEQTAQRLEQTYFATVLVALALAVTVSLAAGPVVTTVLGPGFEPAAQILAILAWGIPGMFLASVSGLYYSLNGLEHLGLLRNLSGLACAVALGLILIPRYGGAGAAMAMVASYTFVAFAMEWAVPRLRRNGVMKAKAFAGVFSVKCYCALFETVARQTNGVAK